MHLFYQQNHMYSHNYKVPLSYWLVKLLIIILLMSSQSRISTFSILKQIPQYKYCTIVIMASVTSNYLIPNQKKIIHPTPSYNYIKQKANLISTCMPFISVHHYQPYQIHAQWSLSILDISNTIIYFKVTCTIYINKKIPS